MILSNLSILVATTSNNGIGKNNKLLYSIYEDMKRFKSLTEGNAVIMGRNTWESLPRKPLPDRKNLILSSTLQIKKDSYVQVISNVDNLIKIIKDDVTTQYFVIGGESIYNQLIGFCSTMYITNIYVKSDADKFFCNFDKSKWKQKSVSQIVIDTSTKVAYNFVTYVQSV